MKKVAFLTSAIIVLAVSVASADPDLTSWQAQAQSTPGNVTADATGWTFDGTAGVPYDYGTLGGTEASVEYIFNLTDSGVSIALGSVYGWGTERNTYKLEQWSDLLVYGITLEGYYDERFPGVSSTFDVDTHVVFVNLPTGNQELYINGVSQGLDTRGGGWWTTGGTGFLGQTSWGADIPVGTIYGVASYNRALSAVEVSSLYDSYASAGPGKASLPDPANLESQVCTNAVLSWEPGIYADKHDVYFGTDETKVTDADRGNQLGVLVSQNQDASHYPIAGALALDFDTTYYWRIDEVNAAPGYDIHKGNVWQFTTEPFVYPIDNITATASSSDPGKGPENTLSLDGDLHSTDTAAMWLSAAESPGNAWIQYEFDKIYKLHEMWVWNYNGEGLNTAFGLKEVAIEYSTNGTDFTALGTTDEFLAAPGANAYAHNTTVDFAGVAAQYVRITANSNWGGGMVDQYGLSEVRFFCVPVHAGKPYPEDEATNVPIDAVLGWKAGRNAARHDLYLGTDMQAVAENAVGPYSITADGSCESSYGVSLELGRMYYWKVNEVNMAEEPNTWEGDVWSFSTPEYFVVDDMESYGDVEEIGVPDSRIYFTWKDGEGWPTPLPAYAGNGTGSVVDLNSVTVYDTPQSMKYYYDNDGTNFFGHGDKEYYSEATALVADLQIGNDWTVGGAKALTLYFYGDPDNDAGDAEQMYVKLNGAKVVYDGDMADITEPSWHEWNIELALFGIDLPNVTQISIGFGSETNKAPAGKGVVYFDAIRLNPARCIPSLLKPSADLNDDCRVDHSEVDIISDNWLIGSYEVTPAAPSGAGLAGHWTFDNAFDLGADSTGNNNGTVAGNAGQSIDAKAGSGALALDGDGDFINVGGGPFFSALDDDGDGFTVAAWVKLVHTPEFSLMRIFSTDRSLSGAGWGFGFIQPPARLRFTTYGIRDYDAGAWMTDFLPDNDQWIHVAAVYKSDGDVDFYVDGMWIETVAGDFSLNDTDGFLIGGLAGTSTEWFEGLIDDLRIYNNELSHGQVGWLAGQSVPYIQDISPLVTPHNPNIDWNGDDIINFADFAGLMQQWLDELFWP